MSSVGRPPEVDKHGNVIQKSLVNVTIPTKLANFLKEKGINRSKLFTDMCKKLYEGKICFNCYGDTLQTTMIGTYCRDCNGNPNEPITWLTKGYCENCGKEYQPPYNMFAQSKDKSVQKGCWDCIPPEERS
jgi:hypothetical protein